MARSDPIQGELQERIMRVLWRKEEAGVEEVRRALPKRHRGAYTTVQTVLNRLADRGLLNRRQVGKAIRYSPAISEADYVTGSLTRSLAGASEEARRTALASLVGDLRRGELAEIRALARKIERKRRRK
jgi:predicted transcriptional regulator